MNPTLVAWDFDGVLNTAVRDGRLIWTARFEADLGVPFAPFEAFVFGSGRFREALVGRRDLRDILAEWIDGAGHDLTPEAVMAYWFARDTHPDPTLVALLAGLPLRSVIATNNERHRARYIRGDMGFGARVERVFASGEMGVMKPDPAFFGHVAAWAGVPPGEILLVDDTAGHVEAARGAGWQGFHFTADRRDGLPAALGRAG